MREAKKSVEVLCTTMDHHYQEVLNRLQALEWQHFSHTIQGTRPSELTSTNDDSNQTATIFQRDRLVTKRTSSKFFHFTFEKDLSVSAVYKKIKFRRSISSLGSVDEPATRLSTISSLSVADVVSRISVLNLAITPAEVYNGSLYTVSSAGNLRTRSNPLPKPLRSNYQLQIINSTARTIDPATRVFPESVVLSVRINILYEVSKAAPVNVVAKAMLDRFLLPPVHGERPEWKKYSFFINPRTGTRNHYVDPSERPFEVCHELGLEGSIPRFELRRMYMAAS